MANRKVFRFYSREEANREKLLEEIRPHRARAQGVSRVYWYVWGCKGIPRGTCETTVSSSGSLDEPQARALTTSSKKQVSFFVPNDNDSDASQPCRSHRRLLFSRRTASNLRLEELLKARSKLREYSLPAWGNASDPTLHGYPREAIRQYKSTSCINVPKDPRGFWLEMLRDEKYQDLEVFELTGWE